MICLQDLIPALRVKNVTIFELLDQEFHYGEFVFFPKLAAYLGRRAAIPAKDAQEIGQISELVYLYAKIHSSVKEGTLESENFRSRVQMPILIGDLFLGRFYRTLAECDKENCLPVYLDFMKQLNSQAIDYLDDANGAEETDSWLGLLAETVAKAVLVLAGDGITDKEGFLAEAGNYLSEQWPAMFGQRIGSVDELDTMLQAEMF